MKSPYKSGLPCTHIDHLRRKMHSYNGLLSFVTQKYEIRNTKAEKILNVWYFNLTTRVPIQKCMIDLDFKNMVKITAPCSHKKDSSDAIL